MSAEQRIHAAAMQIMSEVGVNFNNKEACGILKANGIRVEGSTAYFTEEQVMHWVRMAPESFTIYARNPKYDMVVGGDHVNPAATYGCAFIDDWEGNRRPGTMEDFIKCVKLIHAEEIYDINGGILIQPSDVEEKKAAVEMFYGAVSHSDKAIMLPTGFKNEMELILEASCELFGGKEALAQKPRMIALINTVSPLTLDERMLDCLMLLARYGQPAILCPATMLGATGSISMAGSLASGTAEDLAGIVLAQMIRPGTPVVFGIQSTAADMRGGITFACAAPEGTKMQGFAAKMGKFYGLPSRGGGCQTDAIRINCQAGYESMLTFSSAYRHGINMVMEAGGVMDSVNATSFEKMVVDFEIIRQVKESFKPVEVNEETLNLEEIKEIGHDGTFVTAESTMDNYMDLYSPKVGPRTGKEEDYFKKGIDREMERLLKKYDTERPQLDEEVRTRMETILAKADVTAEEFEKIRTM
ncbi:MAG: trimethylamine methyltransferase family protein [Clostridiales bacterium]|nr:trimethylamine methyltransferase family protein [Clostridiales bacterium]